MYLPHFDYVAPRTTDQLASLLAEHKGNAKILAGGTDLLGMMKDKLVRPQLVIDISGLKDLYGIAYEEGSGLSIGAATKIETILQSPLIKEKYYALHQGACCLGSPQIRAMASVGGNSCNASPCADTPPPLIAYGATARLVSKQGQREVLLDDFITDNGKTVLEADEFLESLFVPQPARNSAGRYNCIGLRKAAEINLVSVAVNIALDGGKINEVAIVLGAVAPTPLRARKAEAILKGQQPDNRLIEEAAAACSAESAPIDDIRASASYRAELVKILANHTLREALEAVA